MREGKFKKEKASGNAGLFESLLDLLLIKTDDHLIADEDRRGGPSPGPPDQLFQVSGIVDHVFLDAGDAFPREELSRRLAGVSGRIIVNDHFLAHNHLRETRLRAGRRPRRGIPARFTRPRAFYLKGRSVRTAS